MSDSKSIHDSQKHLYIDEPAGLEVAPSQAPIAVPRESEGLQSYKDNLSSDPIPVEERKTWPTTQEEAKEEATEPNGKTGRSNKICGLRKTTFWLAVVLAVVIVAGAVGGGVGGSLASKNSSANRRHRSGASTSTASSASASSSSSAVSTSSVIGSSSASQSPSSTSSAVTSGTTGIARFDCPTQQNATYTTPDGHTFQEYCYIDWPRGEQAVNASDGTVDDLDYTTVYSFEDCMKACIQYNNQNSGQTQCQAITYQANLTAAVAGQGGNCFLKNTQGVDVTGEGTLEASAALQS